MGELITPSLTPQQAKALARAATDIARIARTSGDQHYATLLTEGVRALGKAGAKPMAPRPMAIRK